MSKIKKYADFVVRHAESIHGELRSSRIFGDTRDLRNVRKLISVYEFGLDTVHTAIRALLEVVHYEAYKVRLKASKKISFLKDYSEFYDFEAKRKANSLYTLSSFKKYIYNEYLYQYSYLYRGGIRRVPLYRSYDYEIENSINSIVTKKYRKKLLKEIEAAKNKNKKVVLSKNERKKKKWKFDPKDVEILKLLKIGVWKKYIRLIKKNPKLKLTVKE